MFQRIGSFSVVQTLSMRKPSWKRGATGYGRTVLAISVTDRFGAAGLTGVLSLALEDGECEIVDFVLSCRVMGRRVEETLLHVASEWARARGAAEVRARCLPTKKNTPCRDFLRASGWTVGGADDLTFTWDTTAPYLLPAPITLEWTASASLALTTA